MSVAVFRRGLLDGWRGLTIAVVAVAAMLVLGLAIYDDMDLSIYDGLPEALRRVLGVPEHADSSVLAYNEMLASIGALAFVGVAVAIGAHAVAGEESNRTLHLVLGAPVSRLGFALSKVAAIVVLVAGCGLALWGAAELAPVLLGIETGAAHLGALMSHLSANALFHAALAFAVGAATGRKGLAAGVGAGVMILGWLAAGLLPMLREGAADYVPWTWFNGTKPLVNGVDAGHLGLLLGGAVLLFALGTLVFLRRELRLHQVSASLLERLRALPGASRLLRAPTSGGTLFGIRFAAQRNLVLVVAAVMGVAMGLSMGPLYAAMEDTLATFALSFPDSMVAMFGGGDMTTPAGFLHLEIMGMMAPIAVILVAVAAASAGIAGEEQAKRMSALLAPPLPRARVYATTAATVATYVAIVVVVQFLGVWAGIALGGLEVSFTHLVVSHLLLGLVGWFFGALALFLSALTGSTGATVWGTTGVAVATYFGYTLLLAAGREELGWWSPFRAYLYGPPLESGIEWWQPTWLAIGTVVLLAAGAPAFARRDLR